MSKQFYQNKLDLIKSNLSFFDLTLLQGIIDKHLLEESEQLRLYEAFVKRRIRFLVPEFILVLFVIVLGWIYMISNTHFFIQSNSILVFRISLFVFYSAFVLFSFWKWILPLLWRKLNNRNQLYKIYFSEKKMEAVKKFVKNYVIDSKINELIKIIDKIKVEGTNDLTLDLRLKELKITGKKELKKYLEKLL